MILDSHNSIALSEPMLSLVGSSECVAQDGFGRALKSVGHCGWIAVKLVQPTAMSESLDAKLGAVVTAWDDYLVSEHIA